MAISKVNYGNNVLLDLTGDTIKKEKLLRGFTAHDASGERITGTMAIQESKSVIITENGTTIVTPDDGYESVKKVNVDVNVSGGFPNGTEWTQSNITSGDFKDTYNANGIWVACCSGSKGIYYSADGKVWTQSNITNERFYSVYNANGIWVACGSGSNGLYYSIDGKIWTHSNITSGSFYSIYNANGIWVVASEQNKGLYYSTDGKVWNQSNITSGYFYSIYNANGIWVACSNIISKGIYYSISWELS